jgi:serine/threonine protein kinase
MNRQFLKPLVLKQVLLSHTHPSASHALTFLATTNNQDEHLTVKFLLNRPCMDAWFDSLPLIALPAGIDHPNLVYFKGWNTVGPDIQLVSEFCAQQSLAHLLKCMDDYGAAFSHLQIKLILYDVLRGLQHLHAAGIVHGFLTLDNVVVSDRGVAKIADYIRLSKDDYGYLPNEPASWQSPERRKGETPTTAVQSCFSHLTKFSATCGRLVF